MHSCRRAARRDRLAIQPRIMRGRRYKMYEKDAVGARGVGVGRGGRVLPQALRAVVVSWVDWAGTCRFLWMKLSS